MSEYAPGTVAAIVVGGYETTGLAAGEGWMYADSGGAGRFTFEHVTEVRPCVVLDPSRFASIEKLILHLRGCPDCMCRELDHLCLGIADQIEQQVKPPKPEEPQQVGAVVEDFEGVMWALHQDGSWVCLTDGSHRSLPWSAIDAERVRSEGVRP